MKPIVWLASYPKSGNTWFRAFLANFLRDAPEPADINALDTPMVFERVVFDAAVGYETDELRPDELERLRPDAHAHLARAARETLYCKVHDACTRLPDGRLLFPPEATAGALYFIRNPLDVCVSMAQHAGHERYDNTIRVMASPQLRLVAPRGGAVDQLPQTLLSWSGHVASWTETTELRVHVVRYEDMKLRPTETFAAATRFLGLPDAADRLERAIAFSRFEELSAQEKRRGFRERLPAAKSFFRQGEIGGWRAALTSEQARQIVRDHEAVMRRFGYLDAAGAPAF